MKYKVKYLFLALTFSLGHTYLLAQNKIDASAEVPTKTDSLVSLLKNAKQDTNKLKILYQLGEEATDDQDVLHYAKESLRLAEKLSTSPKETIARAGKQGIGDASNTMGFFYNNQGDIPKALEWYNKALRIQEGLGNKQKIALSLNNIAYIYNNQGNIPKALEGYHKALKIQEEIGDKQGIAYSLNNIGSVYNSQGDIPKALDAHQRALKIREEIKDREGVANSINNLARIYANQGTLTEVALVKAEFFNKALQGYRKALIIRTEIADKQGIAYSLNGIAYIYNKQGDILEALEWNHKALNILVEIGDKYGIAGSLNNIAAIELKLKHYKEAEYNGTHSLQTGKELGFPALIRNASKTLSEIFQQQNKYKDAFEMIVLFKQMADSINNVETRKSGLKKQMQYEFEKKESATKAEQNKKDAVAAEEKQRQKVITYSISAGLFLVLLLALFILRGYRQKQKANTIITQQKMEVEAKNHLIEEKNKDILDSIKYARRIQTSLLPTEKYIERILSNKDENYNV